MRLFPMLGVIWTLTAGQSAIAQAPSGGPTAADLEVISDEIDALRMRNEAIAQRLDDSDADSWLNAERSSEIREIVGEIIRDSSARTSLQTSNVLAGYEPGRGFFLKSADDSFSLHINGQIQVRWVLNHNNSGQGYDQAQYWLDQVNDTSTRVGPKTAWGTSVRRAKVRFGGNVFDPTWTYRINGAFSSTDGSFYFDEVDLTKSFDNGMSLRFGQFKAPFLREELVGSQNQLAVDRSLVNSFFSQSRSVGMTLGYKANDFRAEVYYGNGLRTAINDQERFTNWSNNATTWAFAGRLEYKIAGDWADFHSFTSEPGHETAIMVGVGAMGQEYNANADGLGAFGFSRFLSLLFPFGPSGFNLDGSEVYGVTADVSAKFGGVSLFGAFVWQQYSITGQGDIAGIISTDKYTIPKSNPWGFVAQAGYSVTDQVEVFGRYSYMQSDMDDFELTASLPPALGGGTFGPIPIPVGESNLSVITVGANYFWNENVKTTIDWGINLESTLVGVGDGNIQSLGWGPTDTGQEWVLRAQIQLIF